jgi:hypothetical protein
MCTSKLRRTSEPFTFASNLFQISTVLVLNRNPVRLRSALLARWLAGWLAIPAQSGRKRHTSKRNEQRNRAIQK